MKNATIAAVLTVSFFVISSHAQAQSNNVGYYIEVDHSNNVTTYEKVSSRYLAGIENEPALSTDIQVSWTTSGNCNDGSETACISGMNSDRDQARSPGRVSVRVMARSENISEMTFIFNDIGDDIPDRIKVYGKKPPEPKVVMHCVQCGDSLNTFNEGILRTIDRFPFEESTEAEACDSENFENLLDEFLTSDEQDMLADFLNSQEARDLWSPSNFLPWLYFSMRREQGGLLMPDGTSWDYFPGDNLDSGPCNASFGIPGAGARPPRSILIHTHPWRNGENQEICHPNAHIYGNFPGDDDAAALVSHGLQTGLILDADGFIVYGPDGEYVFVEGECGFSRL